MQMCIREDQRNTNSKGLDKLIKPHRQCENWRLITDEGQGTSGLALKQETQPPLHPNCQLIEQRHTNPRCQFLSDVWNNSETLNMTGTPVPSMPNSPNHFGEPAWKISVYCLYMVRHKRNTWLCSNGYISLQKTHEAKALLTIKQLLPPSVKCMLL